MWNQGRNQTWGNRNDWTDQKWHVIIIVFNYIANLIVVDDYFRD